MSASKPVNIPFLILTLSTILGIIVERYVLLNNHILIICFLISITLLAISWVYSKKIFFKSYSFTIFSILFFIMFGVLLVKAHDPKRDPNHYTHLIDIEKNGTKRGLQFSIQERLKSTSYYHKYVVSLERIDSSSVHGKLLLQIPKEKQNRFLKVGDSYTALGKINDVLKPLNPHQFDYSSYLNNLYIYGKTTISPNLLLNNHKPKISVYRLADQIRTTINQKLANYSFTQEQLAIINALFLGQRQDISKQIVDQYQNAGAIHILAVSGLHVGILFLIVNLILRPVYRSKKNGKIIALCIMIGILWSFAILAGLSASVLRAVTMFSFVAIGNIIGSQTNVYNSLFVSIFVLLCFNPLFVFSVGFQLSYLAVFGIVWMQPILVFNYQPKFFITKKLWETLTVTFAAQLGVLPLSILYFNEFPMLFFVSNMIIVPFLGILLGFGILIILLSLFEILPQYIADLFGNCIKGMNTIINWVAQWDTFIVHDIRISSSTLLTLYILIILLIKCLQKTETYKLYGIGICTGILFVTISIENSRLSKLHEFIIFQQTGNTILGTLENQKLKLESKTPITANTQQFLIKNYQIQNQLKEVTTFSRLKKVYQFKEHILLIIDSTGMYNTSCPDILLLSNSPKIHLDRVLDSLTPKEVIADGSNYKSYLKRWEKTCLQKKIPFHRTDKKGAYILK